MATAIRPASSTVRRDAATAPAVTLIARPAPRSLVISAGAECPGEPEANAVLDHLGASRRYLARFVYCESAKAGTLRTARSIASAEWR
jgi:hypothetical protein